MTSSIKNSQIAKSRRGLSDVPAGQVIFGQFIDHDITLDTTSRFNRVIEASDIENIRTPTLDLDCIYGDGPEPHPFLFHHDGDLAEAGLLKGNDEVGDDVFANNDLLRSPNVGGAKGEDGTGRGRAIIGDPRNDENRIISQMQLGFIRFHNLVAQDLVDEAKKSHDDPNKEPIPIPEGAELYEQSRQITTWHYQWSVVNDFLVHMCGKAVVDDILKFGRVHYCPSVPFIPVEFSVAAFRFGHSMVPQKIATKDPNTRFPFFGKDLGQGFSAVSKHEQIVHWNALLDIGTGNEFQRAAAMDEKLATALLDLPFVPSTETADRSLAVRNLRRGNALLLPAGELVALEMGRPDAEIETVVAAVESMPGGTLAGGIPLWLYILVEAGTVGRETTPDKFEPGMGLGPVGARIVAEVIIGLLELDDRSFLGPNRDWQPLEKWNTLGKILNATQ